MFRFHDYNHLKVSGFGLGKINRFSWYFEVLADLFFFIYSSRIYNSQFNLFVLICFTQLFCIFISFPFMSQFRFSDMVIPPGLSDITLTRSKNGDLFHMTKLITTSASFQ